MEVELYMSRLAEALEVDENKRNGEWAHRVCVLTREIQEAVFNSRPERKFVKREVVPLLRRAADAVDRVPRKGRYKNKINDFVGNIRARADDLEQNYVNGKPSEFAPAELRERAANSTKTPEACLETMLNELKQ